MPFSNYNLNVIKISYVALYVAFKNKIFKINASKIEEYGHKS